MIVPPALDAFRRRRLDRAARIWVVRLDAGLLSDRQRRRFERWMQREGAADALRRSGALWEEIDRAVVAEPVAAMRLGLAERKRRFVPVKSLVGGAAVAALALWTGPSLAVALQADARTGTGEFRTVELADGSRIELDSDAAIGIDYARGERRIDLLKGQAAFKVAPDASRPFIVSAAGGETRALGTEFLVDANHSYVRVTGIEHRIRVTAAGGERDLGPGQAVNYSRFAAPSAVMTSDADAGSWRRGVLLFENRPLSEIAEELGRYSDRSLWVVGAARGKRFSGVFRTSDPIAGLRAAAETSGLRLAELPGAIIISKR